MIEVIVGIFILAFVTRIFPEKEDNHDIAAFLIDAGGSEEYEDWDSDGGEG